MQRGGLPVLMVSLVIEDFTQSGYIKESDSQLDVKGLRVLFREFEVKWFRLLVKMLFLVVCHVFC